MSSAGDSAGLPPHDPLQKETYVALIRRAIGESPDGALTLNEIYDAMERKHPDIALNRPGWKNTTRHCLSMNPCFVNAPKAFPLPGRGGYWTVDVNAPESYSRNRSKKKPTRSKTSSVSPASLTSPLPSSKRTRRKSASGNASASSSKGRGTFSTREQDDDPRNIGSSSYPGSNGGRVDERSQGGSMLGLDEGSEESDEGERRPEPQLPPWTQPQQLQQQRFLSSGPPYPLPPQNYPSYPASYNPYSNNFPPPMNPYIPHPSASSHHLHSLPPFQMHPQQQQQQHQQQQQQQQQHQQNHQHYQQQQQPPFPPFPNSSYSPRLANPNPILHHEPQQISSLPPFMPRMDHPPQYRTNSSSPLLSSNSQRPLPDTLANLVDSGEGSRTLKDVPES
ncbi:hypothetical protein BDY24DRAFT_401790 [Mrakia frigida]|uniref:forkhead box transcription factor n=1 Tax=Mrakia frigida TaxID=29902 RepID=UPI003FCBF06F